MSVAARIFILLMISAQALLGWGAHVLDSCPCCTSGASVQSSDDQAASVSSCCDDAAQPDECCQSQDQGPTCCSTEQTASADASCPFNCSACPCCSPDENPAAPAPLPERTDSRGVTSTLFPAPPVVLITVFSPPTSISFPGSALPLPLPPSRTGDRLARQCVWTT